MKVATWNVGSRDSDAVLLGLQRLRHHGVSAAGLQECGDRKAVLERFCRDNDWDIWWGEPVPGAYSVPILWNPRAVNVTAKGTRQATPATNAGKKGAGPNVVKAKVWNRLRVDSRVNVAAPFVFINGHLPASLYLPRRRAIANKQVAALADMVERREGRVDVIAVMDGNAKPGDRLWTPLRKLGMRQHTHGPTHGRRTIDLVWTLGVGGDVDVIEMPSDHRAAVLHLKEKP